MLVYQRLFTCVLILFQGSIIPYTEDRAMACEDSRIFVGELEESLNDRRAAIQEVLHNSIKDTIYI